MTRTLEELKTAYGEEYPAAMVRDGIRMPLERESRFQRDFHTQENNTIYQISRFTDGSASITALELQQEWGNWSEELQLDFCNSCRGLSFQTDYPDMLRFIMKHGGSKPQCAIAMQVARHLPREEAFEILVCTLHSMNLTNTSNITQGIALTEHPGAEAVLRNHLAQLWTQPALWDNADFVNWMGHDAINCIAHLIELGAPPADFAGEVRQLSAHVCLRCRTKCRNRLSKHYPEIIFPN